MQNHPENPGRRVHVIEKIISAIPDLAIIPNRKCRLVHASFGEEPAMPSRDRVRGTPNSRARAGPPVWARCGLKRPSHHISGQEMGFHGRVACSG